MKNILLIPAASVLLLSAGCKKEQTTCSKECVPLPECHAITMPSYSHNETGWSNGAELNPANPYEILFWKHLENKLVIYNVLTGSQTYINSVSQISSLRWRGEWILYNRWVGGGGWGEIYRIRPDGTGNMLLTEGHDRFRPTINPAGNLFLYDKSSGPVIMDFEGNVIKQVIPNQNVNIFPSDWYNDSLLLCDDNYNIYTLNLNTGELKELAQSPHPNGSTYFGFPKYIGNNECVWHCEEGLMKTNILTKETVPFISSCNSVRYSIVHYVPSISKILCVKATTTNLEGDPCQIYSKYELIWVNLDGTNEQVVNISGLL